MPTAEELFADNEIWNPQLSPDGRKIAWLRTINGKTQIEIESAATEKTEFTSNLDCDIVEYQWVGDDMIAATVDSSQGSGSNLCIINVATGDIHRRPSSRSESVRLGDDDGSCHEEVFFSVQEEVGTEDLYKLNLASKSETLVERGNGTPCKWIMHDNAVRGKIIVENGVPVFLHNSGGVFRRLLTGTRGDTIYYAKYGDNRDEVEILTDIGSDTVSLIRIDIATGKKEVVYSPVGVDLTHAVWLGGASRCVAVAAMPANRAWTFFDRRWSEDYSYIEHEIGSDFDVASQDKAGQMLVVRAVGPESPRKYYLFDRRKTELRRITRGVAGAANWRSVCMPIELAARDGLVLRGYFVEGFDQKSTREQSRPCVIYVHGGPWERVNWEYDPMTDFLASRGYNVVRINFRGSTGYGKAFVSAGDRQWGKAMQDDVTDAVEWAIKNKHAARGRIAILGASYGGYSALCGATFTPELYCAAVSICGPTDLVAFLESIPAEWQQYRELILRRIGDTQGEKARLESVSPINFVERIKIPLFIAQGANDQRVSMADTDRYVKKLRERGVPVEYLVKSDEGHGFAKQENVVELCYAIEHFLARAFAHHK